jgi:tRNA threonylcarbamoyladenosine biosynthesis protein TsaB
MVHGQSLYLYLDTTERDSFTVALIAGSKVAKKRRVKSVRGHSEKLLAAVAALLKSVGRPAAMTSIVIVRGPGSFTSLRIGVSCANALAYGLGVPVVGVGKDVPMSGIHRLFARIRPSKKINIVVPEYGREPDIVMKK